MTDADLTAAVDRLNKHDSFQMAPSEALHYMMLREPGEGSYCQREEDRAKLAAAYRRERDETPVDEAYLRACGKEITYEYRDLHTYIIGWGIQIEFHACAGPECWRPYLIIGHDRHTERPTRGRLRRLCAALGIPLTEPADAR